MDKVGRKRRGAGRLWILILSGRQKIEKSGLLGLLRFLFAWRAYRHLSILLTASDCYSYVQARRHTFDVQRGIEAGENIGCGLRKAYSVEYRRVKG